MNFIFLWLRLIKWLWNHKAKNNIPRYSQISIIPSVLKTLYNKQYLIMCCFFKNEETKIRPKIQVWIIIDCILNICYGFLLFIILDSLIGSPGGIVGPIWSFIVIIANIVLLFTLKNANLSAGPLYSEVNTKLMLFWIFITGINISLLLITAIFFVYLSINWLLVASQPVKVILNKIERNILPFKNIQSTKKFFNLKIFKGSLIKNFLDSNQFYYKTFLI